MFKCRNIVERNALRNRILLNVDNKRNEFFFVYFFLFDRTIFFVCMPVQQHEASEQ